jgi:hypothetical protein
MSVAVPPIRPKLVASGDGIDDILADPQVGFDAARKYRSRTNVTDGAQAVAAM